VLINSNQLNYPSRSAYSHLLGINGSPQVKNIMDHIIATFQKKHPIATGKRKVKNMKLKKEHATSFLKTHHMHCVLIPGILIKISECSVKKFFFF
jgi:hypothetical protein